MPSVNLRVLRLEPEIGKYEALFEQASDAILALELTFGTPGQPSPLFGAKIDAANLAAQELTGFIQSELEKNSVSILVPTPGVHRIPDRARPFSAELLKIPGTYEDVAVLRKDGYVRLVELTVRHVQGVRAEGQPLALALFRDVTEKKRMERELITKHAELRNAYYQLEHKNAELQSMQQLLVQAGKLAALGELSAGIAHELNQPLQGIRGYAQELQAVLEKSRGDETELREHCREIISNVDKMASIIDYLRAFTRKSVEKHEPTDLHAVIEEALKMLSRQFSSRGIRVHRDFQTDLPLIHANPLQLEQVFINLATNARDSIEATQRGSGNVWLRTRSTDDFVEVEFRDDGIGMSEKIKSKIFNPFFTTKEVGKGMGLGLSLSYGMISKLHGSIVVQSEPGKGAAFFIRLPRDFRELA